MSTWLPKGIQICPNDIWQVKDNVDRRGAEYQILLDEYEGGGIWMAYRREMGMNWGEKTYQYREAVLRDRFFKAGINENR